MLVKVKNIRHTGSYTPERFGFSSWKAFWENRMHRAFDNCAVSNCYEPATVGGHVIRVDNASKRWYIVPLCKGCNVHGNDQPFYVEESMLCPVNP